MVPALALCIDYRAVATPLTSRIGVWRLLVGAGLLGVVAIAVASLLPIPARIAIALMQFGSLHPQRLYPVEKDTPGVPGQSHLIQQ
jgi:hypothetical protein